MSFLPSLRFDRNKALLRAVDTSLAVIRFDCEGTILEANGNFLTAVGYTASEIVGRKHRMFMPDDEGTSAAYRAFWDRLRSGQFQEGSFRRVSKGGRDIWLRATYNPVFDRSGKVVEVVKLASDITAETFKSIDDAGQIEAIHRSQAVISFAPDGTILGANDNFLATMGYSLSEIVGRHHRLFVAPEDAASSDYAAFWETLNRGRFQVAEYRRIGKGGREVWIRASYNPIMGGDGRVLKIVKFAVDVTADKMRNADYEGQIAAINKSQAVITFALDGTILDANENFLKTTGYRLDEIKGRHHRLFVEESYARSDEYRQFWQRLAAGENVSAIYQRFGKNHQKIWLQASYNPIFDASGRPMKVVKYATDITSNMNARSTAVEAAEDTLNKVEVVAKAAEDMSQSIGVLCRSMMQSKEAVDGISTRAREAGHSTSRMKTAAQSMGAVVDLITNVAGQINLLALNATIESARAGAAGKGFAVVASEVKTLAGQTSAATTRIADEIAAMQAISDEVVGALDHIGSTLVSVQDYVAQAAQSMQAQNISTREISTNMQSAAEGVASIGHSLDNWIVGMEERRGDERARTFRSATIHLGNGTTLACSVRNLSRGGAKLFVPEDVHVDHEFRLQISDETEPRRCRIVRKVGGDIGVKFVTSAAIGSRAG